MYVRPMILVAFSGLLLSLAPVTVRTGYERDNRPVPAPAADAPGPPRIDEKRAATLSEKEILDYLATPETDGDETACLLEALGRFNESHAAVEALIRWLEFEDCRGRKKGLLVGASEYNPPPKPAAWSLKRIGVFAVPQLVDEYIFFFENFSLAARESRYAWLACDQRGKPLEVQRPYYRLSCINVILIHTPEVTSRAVECAWDRMRTHPDDDRVQRACRELIRLTHQFHWEEYRTRLFGLLTQNAPSDRAALVPLLDDRLPVEERTKHIAGLVRFDDSPVVLSQLVAWLEFRPGTKGVIQIGANGDKPHALDEYPAAVALTKLGPAAAPQLVGDYVHFFENIDCRENRYREYAWLDCEKREGRQTSWPVEVQSPAHRLSLIVMVLSRRPELAQRAVEDALRRLEAGPKDVRVRRACRALIRDLVAAYPPEQRARLFPGALWVLDGR
jgi:hypothetical protein